MADNIIDRRAKVIIAAPLVDDPRSLSISAQTLELASTDDAEVGFRLQFKVEKTLDKAPNTGDITITNLSASTRASLQSKNAKVILLAGYGDSLGQIFVGDIRTIDHVRNGSDWETKLQSGDGERAFLSARISTSFGVGTGAIKVIDTAATKLTGGPIIGDLSGLSAKQFAGGYVMHGPASRELDKVLKANGYEWSIQDGHVYVRLPGAPVLERIVSISPDSGLVGSPEHGTSDNPKKPPLLKIKCLLSPELHCGGRVHVQSERYTGIYTIHKLTHTGDTAGGDFYSEMEVEA